MDVIFSSSATSLTMPVKRTVHAPSKHLKYSKMSVNQLKQKVGMGIEFMRAEINVSGTPIPGVVKPSQKNPGQAKYWTANYLNEKVEIAKRRLTARIGEQATQNFLREACERDIVLLHAMSVGSATVEEDPFFAGKDSIVVNVVRTANTESKFAKYSASSASGSLVEKYIKLSMDAQRPYFLKIPKDSAKSAKLWSGDYMAAKSITAGRMLEAQVGAEVFRQIQDAINSSLV